MLDVIFQSTPPARGATNAGGTVIDFVIFQSTPPARGATGWNWIINGRSYHFNPRPPRGGRQGVLKSVLPKPLISIPAPREGGDVCAGRLLNSRYISIHAPREGGDVRRDPAGRGLLISIHAPREGGDITQTIRHSTSTNFNPRPPRGGRQYSVCVLGICRCHFNPRPPRGGRPHPYSSWERGSNISIHAPREGGDIITNIPPDEQYLFQSTPPARGATSHIHQ